MVNTTRQRRMRWALPLAIGALSGSASADDQEVRIGRYTSVRLDPPLTRIDTVPQLESVVLPQEISSRSGAVMWLLAQYDYELRQCSPEAADLADALAAPLSIGVREALPGSLRLALHAVLGPRMTVLIDPGTRQVLLSMLDAEDKTGNDE